MQQCFILQSNTHTHQPEYFFIRKYFFFMLPQCSRQTITLDRVTNNSLRKRELTSTKKQCSKGSVGPQSAGSWGLTQWVPAQHSLQQQMSPTAPPCRPEGPKQFQNLSPAQWLFTLLMHTHGHARSFPLGLPTWLILNCLHLKLRQAGECDDHSAHRERGLTVS